MPSSKQLPFYRNYFKSINHRPNLFKCNFFIINFRLETSEAPDDILQRRHSSGNVLESSLLVPTVNDYRLGRFLKWIELWDNDADDWKSISTVTTTVYTSFSFLTSTVIKSFTLASSLAPGGPGLLCLPNGYYVC